MKKIWILGFILALGLLLTGSITADETIINELFADIPVTADVPAQDQQNPTIKRSRYVLVKFENLGGENLEQGAEAIVLNLFHDLSFIANKERIEKRSSNQYTWFGHIKGSPHSQVILVVDGKCMAGNIRIDGKLYQIQALDEEVHAIYEIDQSAFPDEAPPIPVKIQDDVLLDLHIDQNNDSAIDIMVVYSDDVADAVGNIDTLIQLAIDETNESYAHSNINQRIRLVHSVEVDYIETGNSNTDLDRLKSQKDGYLDNVHTLRNTYGADCVSFWVKSLDTCGRAYQMLIVTPIFTHWAFSVVRQDCATGHYSFAHELGHNMGAKHDCYVNKGIMPYQYSHGYVNTEDRWRTIMAYDDECEDLGFDCTRIQYWSNPSVIYGGDPTGEEIGNCYSNNAKTLNNTASIVANFSEKQVCFINLLLDYSTP